VRLIDADELLKHFHYGEYDTEHDKAWVSTVRRIIKEQPTAYDVDEVICDLQDEIAVANDARSESISNMNGVSQGYYEDLIVAFKQAIEIVKRGGIE
jgi:LPS O-antigen subunit length determinant protein (WzzB/FepE family)